MKSKDHMIPFGSVIIISFSFFTITLSVNLKNNVMRRQLIKRKQNDELSL